MSAQNFAHLSPRNAKFNTQLICVANGTEFVALEIMETQKLAATSVLYMHVHRELRKCYIGVTVQEARKRWLTGTTYSEKQSFGRALKKYGWKSFDSYILAFADDKNELNAAEIIAIKAAGGHRSRYTYNLSPGGDLVADNNIPIIGIYLPTGESRNFAGGSEAARQLRFASTDTPMAVIRGEITAARDWWFRLADDNKAKPPKLWGEKLRFAKLRGINARPLIAINYKTMETRKFPTADEAAITLLVNQSEVWAVAHGKSHSAGGWWFQFEGDNRPMPELHSHAAARAKRDRKVYAINLKTSESREFRNCTVADKELGIYKGASAMVASGERISAANWWFSYKKDAPPPTEYKFALVAKARSKAVVAVSPDGTEHFYQSAKAAAEALGISRALISCAISGKRKSAKGYLFRFAK